MLVFFGFYINRVGWTEQGVLRFCETLPWFINRLIEKIINN